MCISFLFIGLVSFKVRGIKSICYGLPDSVLTQISVSEMNTQAGEELVYGGPPKLTVTQAVFLPT